MLLYEDEFSLSNTATVGYLWGQKGKQPQVLCKQRKRERQTVFGSFNYNTGQMTLEFDTVPLVNPLKPFTGGGCSSVFNIFVGRKLFGKYVYTLYFRGLWLFYVRRQRKAEPT